MAKSGGGGGDDVAPAPPHGQVYLPQWQRIYGFLLKRLRQAHAQIEELALEREHLVAELDFQRLGRRDREEILQARIQKIGADEACRTRAEKAEAAKLLGDKELELRRYQKLAELTETDLEDFRSSISCLAAENTELKAKMKQVESQAELSENNVGHKQCGKDLRAELRKLKQAYKTLSKEKDNEISALCAEKSFVWNQYNRMEEEYRAAFKSKNIEAKQANEAAAKLQKNIDELQVIGQKKDGEIDRLQAEVTNAKKKMLILESELQRVQALVKDKDVETDKPENSRSWKKGISETQRKSKSEGHVLREKARDYQVTPVRREVKTSGTRMSRAKEIQSQQRTNLNLQEERGQSGISQKRKRGSSLSYAA